MNSIFYIYQNYKNNLVVKFNEDGSFRIDLSRQLVHDSIAWYRSEVPYILQGNTYTDPPQMESLTGRWEWSTNASQSAVLYFHQPDFFEFIAGKGNAATYQFPYYKAPFVVKVLDDNKLELEFINDFSNIEYNGGGSYEKRVFTGINQLSLTAK